jgi:hypothetical protein
VNGSDAATCCPRFDPGPWDFKTLSWENRRFVKDRVRSFLHIPLNFGSVMRRNLAAIQAAGASPESPLVLADENSLWGADLYVEATRDVPGAQMATISGTFLCRVFDGPYRKIPKWVQEMKEFVRAKGKVMEKLYFLYATCPRCAKKYGKNYVVLVARV